MFLVDVRIVSRLLVKYIPLPLELLDGLIIQMLLCPQVEVLAALKYAFSQNTYSLTIEFISSFDGVEYCSGSNNYPFWDSKE